MWSKFDILACQYLLLLHVDSNICLDKTQIMLWIGCIAWAFTTWAVLEGPRLQH